MRQYIIWIELAGVALMIAAGCYATWYATSDHYQAKIAAMERDWARAYAAAAESQLDRVQADQLNRKQSEEQHGKDQLVINGLAADLRRVRIHIPTGSCAGAEAGAAGESADGGGRLFSEGVDAAFERLQGGVDALVRRADQLNIDAARLNRDCGAVAVER